MLEHRRTSIGVKWLGIPVLPLLAASFLTGCSGQQKDRTQEKDSKDHKDHADASHKDQGDKVEKVDIKSERDKLKPEDRKLVDQQEFCPIMPTTRLGEMGEPLKLTIKGETVFLCCKGCKRKAEANPDQTLKKVAELKAKHGQSPPK